MRHGKIILSAAALVVTAVGSFAFNNSKKGFTHPLYTTVQTTNRCSTVRCATATVAQQNQTPCATNVKYYTDITNCVHQYNGLTTVIL
jgi:hypothetical protein